MRVGVWEVGATMPREGRARRAAVWLDRLERDAARIIEESGAQGDLVDEVGALRYALMRVLAEIQDPVELSLAVSRIVNATKGALVAQRVVSGDTASDLTEALTRVLAEMGLAE